MTLRPRQLEYFVAVVQEGQMTRAARRLGVAQPALSQAIAQLEEELGLTLLRRHARGVAPTPAGTALYSRSLAAVAATREAIDTARSLARARDGTIAFGFLGAPPSLDSRMEMEGFARSYPLIRISYRDLPFPSSDTSAWMAEVDVAVCHAPPPDPRLWRRLVRREPRMALLPGGHRLAGRSELGVEDVIDEPYVGFSPAVDPDWAGFWRLDDHRGAPPERLSDDQATNPQEVLAALAGGSGAITLVPAAAATVLSTVLADVTAVRLHDAAPARLELVGHDDRRNPLVDSLLEYATRLGLGGEERDR